jgi:transcriptional regulator with XRE-family HTH domain
MSSHVELIARNIRRFRTERRMSIGELARRAGISKQTLAGLEQEQGNPTVETLAAIGAALGVSLRRLVTEWGSPVLVERAATAAWHETGGIATRDLDRTYGSGDVRTAVLRWDRAPAVVKPVPGHAIGALHHLYVLSGRMRCGPESEPVDLDAGDFVQFPADVAHWTAPVDGAAVAHVVTTVPRLSQFNPAVPPPAGRTS